MKYETSSWKEEIDPAFDKYINYFLSAYVIRCLTVLNRWWLLRFGIYKIRNLFKTVQQGFSLCVNVVEKFGSQTVWNGIVHVFKIEGNSKADKCYAWSSPIKGSTKRRYYAVLHIPPIDLPEKAVRASIVQD